MRPAWSKSETPSIAGLRYACVKIEPFRTSPSIAPPPAEFRITLPAPSHIESGLLFGEEFHDALWAKPGQRGTPITNSVLGDRQMNAVWSERRWSDPPRVPPCPPLTRDGRSRRPPWLTATSTRVIALNLNSASDRRERDLGLSGELSFSRRLRSTFPGNLWLPHRWAKTCASVMTRELGSGSGPHF